MAGNKVEKQKVCALCHSCMYSGCKKIEPISYCEFYKKGLNRFEYLDEIRRQHIDLKKLCNNHGISLNIMWKMLRGRQEFTFKYRSVLNSRIFELDEYYKYGEIDG